MKKLFKQGMVIFFMSLAITGYSNVVVSSTTNELNTEINKKDSAESNLQNNIPILKNVNSNVYLNIANEKETNLMIEIYYQGFDLAYKEKHSNVTKLKKTYDFSTSKKGEYTFYIKIGKEIHKEIVTIK